jgi:hypothetical protein
MMGARGRGAEGFQGFMGGNGIGGATTGSKRTVLERHCGLWKVMIVWGRWQS